MKTNHLLILIIVIISACSGNDERSDAYGNFEVDDVIVSAEANGKILELNIREGQKLNKDALTAVIDTTDLVLKRKQLKAQKAASASRLTNINAQIAVQEQQKANLMVDKERVENICPFSFHSKYT